MMLTLPIGQIINEDSINYMDELPTESIDLIIADGPYGLSKDKWDNISNIQEYNLILLKKFSRILKLGGSAYLFGKSTCIDFIDYRRYLNLKSRIVWYCPASLSQGRTSFTNNYDIIAYFIKGNRANVFNLDAVRVPQLTELTHRLRCERVPSVTDGPYGNTKFNDAGKNPGDVWGDIKQLTYNSKELARVKIDAAVPLHTIQKPKKLIERIVKVSSNEDDIIFDPFLGYGTTLVVCKELNRKMCFGCEIDLDKISVINERLKNNQTTLFDGVI